MIIRRFVLLGALLSTGCVSSTKVAHGERFTPDDGRYDPYFETIHQQQVNGAAWPDDRKAARKPLLVVLTLPESSTDDLIVNATRTRAKALAGGGGKLDLASAHVTPIGSDPPLFAAVEESVRLELDRARKRHAGSDKLEDLAKKGEALEKEADQAFENRGAERADDKKTAARRELRSELGAAVTAMRDLEAAANKDVQTAQDFLDDLGDAVEAKERQPHKPHALPPPPAPAAAAPPPPPADTKPPPKPAKPKSSPPPPTDKPKAPPPPPDDVFNP